MGSINYTRLDWTSVARWRSARGMIEWMCTQERWNPEVAIIFGAAARYRRATVGSSHDGAHPDNSTLHTGRFARTPALWGASSSYRPVRAMAVRKCSNYCCQLFRVFRGRALFVRGMMHPYFSVDRRPGGALPAHYTHCCICACLCSACCGFCSLLWGEY